MRSTRWLAMSLIVILLDQLSKHWISQTLNYGESAQVTPFFNLVLTYNRGAAFSFLNDAGGWQHYFFSGIAIIASVIMVWLLYRHTQEKLFSFAVSLILGGAIGNLIDRLNYGYVIDFLLFYIRSYHWPAFNIADSAITCGAIILIWKSFHHTDIVVDDKKRTAN